MKQYLSLLRGINVSGQKLIKMQALATMFGNVGFTYITTYIQSGNVLFNVPTQTTTAQISQTLQTAIQQTFGFEVVVITLTSEEVNAAINQNPFIAAGIEQTDRLYLTILQHPPQPALANQLQQTNYLPEQIHIIDRWVYFYSPDNYGRAKLNNNFMEAKLKTPATTRNWKTMLTLQTMFLQ